MNENAHQLWLIPALPLAGALINGVVGQMRDRAAHAAAHGHGHGHGHSHSHSHSQGHDHGGHDSHAKPDPLVSMVSIGSVLLAFLWVSKTLIALGDLNTAYVERYFTWIASGSLNVGFDLAIDRLSAVMLLVVTGIGTLIHIYATGYMSHEKGYYRFFCYLNLFMFFMLILVLGANYLLLFIGWEGVGLCSYLLIGFYFLKKSAGDAGKKAFIVNRVGDFGFALAMLLIFIHFGSLDFGAVLPKASGVDTGILTAIGLLLLVGACGKSAQVPLYVWLPDAMEGPTPVSALIHAATMVTAGVYMVARSFPIYEGAPMAREAVALIGLATAVMAATIGLAQNDIKKVFAYSTVSQLGFMFLGLGVGAYGAGIYHVVTHAFFKALLFLGAGSVIHALGGEQDIRNMGGLRTKIPWTFATLFIAAFAIAGFPGLSGYYSKHEILLAAHHHAHWMYWVGTITAGITSFYVFRCIFLTFFGEYRGKAHPHESPAVMLIPLILLAGLSIAGGFLGIPHWLEPFFPKMAEGHDAMAGNITTLVGLGGIVLAYLFYVVSPGIPEGIANSLRGLYNLIDNKYYVDEAYDSAIVHPLEHGSRIVLWRGVDAGFIDGIVNGMGGVSRSIGGALRTLQSGNIRSYANWVVLGAVIFLVMLGAAGGAR
ncbi:MAG: NADH-quinone oxidoreductase subunit L [Acidobacteria bacterium]|nr:NADH-quinone oxidoreductase subunit L [Acidobacteriota bacterium]